MPYALGKHAGKSGAIGVAHCARHRFQGFAAFEQLLGDANG